MKKETKQYRSNEQTDCTRKNDKGGKKDSGVKNQAGSEKMQSER